jgi:AcrR family transcriptional regulator
MREVPNAREAILQATARLAAAEGVRHVTIERVAAAAGLSRGGVLYHFPSKDALIAGLVTQLVEGFQQALDGEIARDPDPRARFTRAYLRLTLLRVSDAAAESGGAIAALLVGLAYNPQLLAPFHKRLLEWQRQSEAELDADLAAIMRLTTHALWTNELLLPNAISADLLRAIVARLEGLALAEAHGERES